MELNNAEKGFLELLRELEKRGFCNAHPHTSNSFQGLQIPPKH